MQQIKTRWTKQQVEDLVKREKLAYQKIDLPYGLVTAGRDRSQTSEVIFEGGVEGKSVLDVGCFLGYFCHEAVRRGARRVVGLEIDETRLRQAEQVADCLGMDIEFRLADIEDEPLTEQFDVTLMLNVLHHFRDPIAVLDKVIAHTRDRVIFEIAGPTSERPKQLLKSLGASWLTRRRIEQLPVIVVGRNWAVERGAEQRFFFSPAAMRHLLLMQRGSFARIEIKKTGFKNRYLLVAWKRQIGHLIVIGGMTSSGKTTFIDGLCEGRHTEIAEQIGMTNGAPWTYSDASRIVNIETPRIDNVIYHYDLLRVFARDTHTYARERGMDVMDCADKRMVVTIWCDPQVMYERLTKKIRSGMRPWRRRRIEHLCELYSSPRRMAGQYEKWIAWCRQKGADLGFVDCTREPRLMTESEWTQNIETLHRA